MVLQKQCSHELHLEKLGKLIFVAWYKVDFVYMSQKACLELDC